MTTDVHGSLLAPDEGRTICVGPNRITIKVDPDSGMTQFGIFESVLPPGAGVSAHRHHTYEEVFYVLDGAIEYRLDERRVTARSGACIVVPAGVAHAFRNMGSDAARHLVVHAPMRAFAMIEALGRAGSEQFAGIMARFDSEPVDELVEHERPEHMEV